MSEETYVNPHELIDLVNCIANYFKITCGEENTDPSEDWKRKAGIINKCIVPNDMDLLIRKSFVKQLKKYS